MFILYIFAVSHILAQSDSKYLIAAVCTVVLVLGIHNNVIQISDNYAIENNELEITVPTIGERFTLGETSFEVIYTGTGEKDLNEASIILKMIF